MRTHVMATLAWLSLIAADVAHAQDGPQWPDLTTDAGAQGGGEHDAALVVGVGSYYNLPPIAGAVENATAWQQWLLRSRKVRPERVVLLTDREATKEKIEKNLKALAADVGPQGTLWFVFIGHGAPSGSGDDGLLLGVDTDADADSIGGRGVSQRSALALVGAGRQAHSVVVFDACFSGRTGDGSATLVPGLQATLPTRRAAPPSSTTILAASDSFAGPIPGAGRPAFSYLLLGGLRGWADDNGDKSVSLDEAYAFTRGTIQALFKGTDRLPSKSGPALVLAKNVREPRPDMAALISGTCPANSRWSGRECKELPKVKCPAGTSWNGSSCASECPSGTVWDGAGCVAQTVQCPGGARWDGRACVGACPEGTAWNGSACEGQRVAVVPVTSGQGTRAGEQRPEPKTGATWVWMPPGSFHYGCEPQDTQCDADEKPGRRERVDGFWMMQTEVTVAAYRRCAEAGACPANQLEGDSPEQTRNAPNGRATHPMNCVDHAAAKAFCEFVGGRLPSAVEREYAAKSGGSRLYPWGDASVTGRRANFCDRNCPQALSAENQKTWRDNGWVTVTEDDGYAGTAPVGAFPAGDSPWGLKDMAGNLAEWTVSWYDDKYIDIRGGSWSDGPSGLRAGLRDGFGPDFRGGYVGFRCAQ